MGRKLPAPGLVPAAEQASRPYYGPFSRPRSSGGTFEQHAVCKTRAVFVRAGRVPAAEQSSRPYYGPFSRPRSSGGTFEQHAVCKTRAVFARAGRPCTRCGTGEPPVLRARYPASGPRCQFARQHVEASDTSVGKSTARKRFGQPRKAGIQIQAPAKLKPRHAICPKPSFTLSKGKRLLLRSGVCNAGWDLRWSSYWW